jgi:hypothetical protein
MLLRRFSWSASPAPAASSNVVVLEGVRDASPSRPVRHPDDAATWTIRSDDGATHGRMTTRSEAVRAMSVLAMRGVPLPMLVLDPQGRPTGDRLA